MSLLLGGLAAVALVPSLWFIVDYGRRRWWKTVEGRFIFLQTVIIATMLGAILLGRILGGLGLFIWCLLMGCLAVAQWTLLVQYRRIQREKISQV